MNEKIFIIGFGFIGRYLAPCYEALLGQPTPEQVLAVKASSRGVEELRQQYPYAISVGDTAAVLEREHPTILVLCPPPTEVPGIVREILAPYFERCRREGRRLPVIYTFAPTPSADWFLDELGAGTLAAKILPNVVDRIGSIDMAPIGTNFISLDPRAKWSEADRETLCRFLSPFGENIFLTDDDSLALLAVKITAHIFYEISFSVADVCESRGIPVTLSQLGSAVRAARFSMPDCRLPQLCPCGYDGLPDRVAEFMRRLTLAWYAGIEAYADSLSYTIPMETVRHINSLSFELNVLPVQLETREKLHENTRNHGTKGGVLEKGCIFFERYLRCSLEEMTARVLDGAWEEDFFDFVQGISYTISLAAYRQSYRLTGR